MLKKLLVTGVLLVGLAAPASAAVIADLGVNPRSQQGHFSNEVGGSVFTDQYLFQLSGAPSFITFASATNDFTGGTTGTDYITNFTGQLFFTGGDGVIGGGDDFAVNAPVLAVGCPGNPDGCQILAGAAVLEAGNYFLQISGDGGGTSGYGGNLTVAAVPEASTWLMMLAGFAGVGGMAMRKRRQSAQLRLA
jgi:hypothetical protein